MKTFSQQISSPHQASHLNLKPLQRLIAAAILPVILAAFAVIHFADIHGWRFYHWPCGFKTQFGLPCPTCGMTTSVLAFAGGDILQSFYIQPGSAMFCILLILAGLAGLIFAVAATDFGLVRQIKLKYIIVTFLVLAGGGWAVTLARAMAENN